MPSYVDQTTKVGATKRFDLSAYKDEAAWTLTGGTVNLYLRKPDDTVLGPYVATISGSTATYTTGTSVHDTVGDWKCQWYISVGGVVQWSDEETYTVGRAAA